jgi:uncharacterized protein DUF5681
LANPVYLNGRRCEAQAETGNAVGVSIGVRMREVQNIMPRSKKAESEVGYKRPPMASRFKKGQSGNPHGRRRRAPARIAAILVEELQSAAVISENGRQRKVPKIRVLIEEAVKQAMHGNFQPLVLITKISPNLENLTGAATPKIEEDEFSHLSDDELKKQLIRRCRELFPELGQPPAKKKGDQGGDD